MSGARRAMLLVLLVLIAGCEPAPFRPAELALLESLRLSPTPPPPSLANPVADDERAAALGERLFFDRRLSASGAVACASCHEPARHFTDGRKTARGLMDVPRNTPTLLGAAHLPFLGWEGRRDSLWAQALAPLEDPREHGLSRARLAALVREHHEADYRRVFEAAPDDDDDEHVVRRAGFALEAYLRRLEPALAPFDLYVDALLAGARDGGGHLSPKAVRGLKAFLGPGQCVHCHHGPRFTDGAFHNLGLPAAGEGRELIQGRALGAAALLADPRRCGGGGDDSACPELRFLDPSFEGFLGAFKTPSLRNVARTAPYMHGGQLATLEEVVEFYKELPGEPAVGQRDSLLELVAADLNEGELLAFLESLTGLEP